MKWWLWTKKRNVDKVRRLFKRESEVLYEGVISYSAALLARLLQYQETPQYLRKYVIKCGRGLRVGVEI